MRTTTFHTEGKGFAAEHPTGPMSHTCLPPNFSYSKLRKFYFWVVVLRADLEKPFWACSMCSFAGFASRQSRCEREQVKRPLLRPLTLIPVRIISFVLIPELTIVQLHFTKGRPLAFTTNDNVASVIELHCSSFWIQGIPFAAFKTEPYSFALYSLPLCFW